MNRPFGLLLTGTLSALAASAWSADYCDTEVPTVVPGTAAVGAATMPPSDAIVLFDGKDLSQWKGKEGPAGWDVHDGVVTVRKAAGDIETRRSFQDFQLHVEWRVPSDITGEGQARGNSGVYLQGHYEVQVLDSYHNRTYADGQAGAVYRQSAPLVNAMRPPGEWNVYDIIFTAPRFNPDNTVFSPARVTVLHNGVLIQNNTEIRGDTDPIGRPSYTLHDDDAGPIRLQAHGDPSKPISYRNIWVRELNKTRLSGDPASHSHLRGSLTVDSPIKEILNNPAARAVLSRCVPELVPDPVDTAAIGKMTLRQLQGSIAGLTEAKLRIIDAELVSSRDLAPLR